MLKLSYNEILKTFIQQNIYIGTCAFFAVRVHSSCTSVLSTVFRILPDFQCGFKRVDNSGHNRQKGKSRIQGAVAGDNTRTPLLRDGNLLHVRELENVDRAIPPYG